MGRLFFLDLPILEASYRPNNGRGSDDRADKMDLTRRSLIAGASAMGCCLVLPSSIAWASGRRLGPFPTVDAREALSFRMDAVSGETEFVPGVRTPTKGFGQSYLGPIIRLRSGTRVKAEVTNETDRAISVHWHGLLIPGGVDGGPHNPIAPGETWTPQLDVDQPAATLWYHTHIHGETAPAVYAGLAGILLIDDGTDDLLGLPNDLGINDLALVIQDKRLGDSGIALYEPTVADALHGFLGDSILVNGVVDPVQPVPAGVVRLRLLNASNARNYTLFFSDRRRFHLIGSDQGLLVAPIEVDTVRLTPGERLEILVDFSAGGATLVSLPHDEGQGMGGMGHEMGGPPQVDAFSREFDVLVFELDLSLHNAVTAVPSSLAGTAATDEVGVPTQTKQIILNDMGAMSDEMEMMMNPADMDVPAPGGDPEIDGQPIRFGINGQPYGPARIDQYAELGSLERWIVGSQMMGHPFHIHGVRFQVVSEQGRSPRPENRGWKDTVFVDGEVELLVQFPHLATDAMPFMFHCHVLEHEDRGMMGQLTVRETVTRSYSFEVVDGPVRSGALVHFSVQLIDAADGTRVTDAEIRVRDFNMEPEGMAGSNRVTLLPVVEAGVQPMEVRPDMAGRWALVVEAAVSDGEPITGTIIVRVPE